MKTRFREELRAHRKGWIVVGTIVGLFGMVRLYSCFSSPPIYWGDAIHGRVVDADTGEPLEGAVVVSNWELYLGGIGHGGHDGSLIVHETVTDRDGNFAFPDWGPLFRRKHTRLDYAPSLIVFKVGYHHNIVQNSVDSNAYRRHSEWDGKTITMSRFAGTPADRLKLLDLVFSISALQPLMLAELLKEKPLYYKLNRSFFDDVERFVEDENYRRRFQ